MRKTLTCLISLIILSTIDLPGQNNLEQYTFGFDFVEGIYLTFDEFRSNNPSIRDYQLVTEKTKQGNTKKTLVRIKKIIYSDASGTREKLKKKAVWGLCKEGKIYVLVEDYFQQLIKIGSIIYLVVTTVNKSSIGSYSSTGSAYSGPGGGAVNSPCFIDFKTGGYYRYALKDFLLLLKKDEQLYIEFTMIEGKKEKEHQMINYVDKFNESNPIYFPSTNGQFGVNLLKY